MLIYNISLLAGLNPEGRERLRGVEMDRVECLPDAWLELRDGRVHAYGPMSELPADHTACTDDIDARGGIVMPTFCDSHTHIVWAGSRHGEFVDKINGLTYEEIAARGGGILNSADQLRKLSVDQLADITTERLRMLLDKGTGAVEIKSGYGLSLESELNMLRAARIAAGRVPVTVKTTFLGAHAVGREFAGRQADYVQHVIDRMLPAVAAEGLADFVDVFCDRGFFTVDETLRIMDAAAKYGLLPKIHANELDCSGGVQAGVSRGAVSVDHLERIGQDEIDCLAASQTVATMLPGASFFLGMPYGTAKQAIAQGVTVALASDFNPGSSPSGDMRFVWALGCIKMRLTPEQAFNAVTQNGAAAMQLGHSHGSIALGRPANLIITRPLTSIAEIPYRYTDPWIARVITAGV